MKVEKRDLGVGVGEKFFVSPVPECPEGTIFIYGGNAYAHVRQIGNLKGMLEEPLAPDAFFDFKPTNVVKLDDSFTPWTPKNVTSPSLLGEISAWYYEE